jgi:hypothetical protein
MKNALIKVLSYALGVPLVLLAVGFGIGTSGYLPDHALLIVDKSSGVYYPAFEEFQTSGRVVMTAAEAREHNYKPDEQSKERSAFFEDRGSVSRRLLASFGILPKKEPRWNEDGSWIY